MAKRAADRYENGDDGLPVELVGMWCAEKHKRLEHYVSITSAVRRKYDVSGSTYVDLFCGTGKVKVKGQQEVRDGGALVAYKEGVRRHPFSQIFVGDIDASNVAACESRLKLAGARNVHAVAGSAEETANAFVASANPHGLHLAFLDPYSVGVLPMRLIEALSQLKRMDLLIHISEMDLQRNIVAMAEDGTLDSFAPGWQSTVDLKQKNSIAKLQLLAHWRSLLANLGYHVSDNIERVRGDKNQPLYWLVLASKHPLGDKFWGEVSNVTPQLRLNF